MLGLRVMKLTKTVQSEAYRLVYWQLVIIMGLSLILLLLKGVHSGLSAMLGGLAYGVPNLVFVWRVFRYTGARAAKRFIAAFFIGEAIKLFTSAFLFILMAKYLSLNVSYMVGGFCSAFVAFWIVSM